MSQNRNLAPFYTPAHVAQALTDWAILDSENLILDPSYGGCSFLYAARKTLISRGNPQPEKQIFGVDIDPEAGKYLKALIDAGAAPEQYINEDFFALDLTNFSGQYFDSIVGNPPYIRYHDIPDRLQKRAQKRLKEIGIQISGRASYWAFFLLYSIRFLRRGGRLAMILPGALLHTEYSSQVRELLASNFEEINILLLQERIFQDTEEESVIVCADGAAKPHKGIRIEQVSNISELEKVLREPEYSNGFLHNGTGDGDWLRALIEPDVLKLYDDFTKEHNVIRLGDWVNTRIGVVTGNNDFFVLSEQKRKEKRISATYFVPVIKRPAYLSGIVANEKDFAWLESNNKSYLLLLPPKKLSAMPSSLRKYIQYGEENNVHLAQKCQARDPWYIVPHIFKPDAFMPCMSASWPRLVVNNSSYTCTNNILRLSWKAEKQDEEWLRLALGTLSTFSQLSAELVGRSYGGGVLKLEPTELTRLAVPLVLAEDVQHLAQAVDNLLRQGKLNEATRIVDTALSKANPKFSPMVVETFLSARNKLFFRRRQHRKDASKITARE